MSVTDDFLRAKQNLLFDYEDLASDIGAILGGSPHAPEIMARLLLSFRQAIGSGLQEISRTRDTLLAAIELIYLHSGAHAAALRLYLLSQQGELRVEDEPLYLINAAIGRSTVREHRRPSARVKRRGRN